MIRKKFYLNITIKNYFICGQTLEQVVQGGRADSHTQLDVALSNLL